MRANIRVFEEDKLDLALLVIAGIWANGAVSSSDPTPGKEIDDRMYFFDWAYNRLKNYAYSDDRPKKTL